MRRYLTLLAIIVVVNLDIYLNLYYMTISFTYAVHTNIMNDLIQIQYA